MFTLRTARLGTWLGLAFVALGTTGAPAADSAGIEFFEKKIRPIFVETCYKCHSSEAEKVKGGLLLDTRDGLLKGGETGPALVPGNADKSLLIKAVRYTDENLQMPPKGKRLGAEQIADLEAWVKMGARSSNRKTSDTQPAARRPKTALGLSTDPTVATAHGQRFALGENAIGRVYSRQAGSKKTHSCHARG